MCIRDRIEPVDIVIFGRDRLAFELCQMLREMNLEPVLVHELIFRREWKCAQYIIALSDSDVDNLSMCNICLLYTSHKGRLR